MCSDARLTCDKVGPLPELRGRLHRQGEQEEGCPHHGSEDPKVHEHFPTRDRLGEVPRGDGRAESSRETTPRGPERLPGVGNKSAGPSVWELRGQETFPSGAVRFGLFWALAEFLGVKVQHLCQQSPLPVQVRALTTWLRQSSAKIAESES